MQPYDNDDVQVYDFTRGDHDPLDFWNVGTAAEWGEVLTADQVEASLRKQHADNYHPQDAEISDDQFTHDAEVIARWLAESLGTGS